MASEGGVSSLRDAAGEVDSCQVLGGGDGVPEHGPVGGQELDDIWGQTTFPQHSVDGVAGRHGRVTGLPQDHVPLQNAAAQSARSSALAAQKHRGASLTISAGVPARFPPIAVKLKGATAATKP